MNKTCGNCANYDSKIGFAQICGKCYYDQYANDFEREPSEWKPGKHFTNADYIRVMSDEELCAFILEIRDGDCLNDRCYVNDPHKGCDDCTLEWLKQPYKENEE